MGNCEWAWAAGLFEGEGSLTPSGNGWAAKLGTTDEDVIRRFHEVVGCGTVYGPWQRGAFKPIWQWTCTDKAGLERVAERLGPWLGERRSGRLRAVAAYVSAGTRRANTCV